MRQGTVSILFGCHSVVHSILVLISWRKVHRKWPEPWQAVCIFLHDIGHYGLDYLDNLEQKKRHWELGAKVAGKLFGQRGYDLVAGHCTHSGYPISKLKLPDKHSWYIAPKWWLFLNNIAEPKLAMGYGKWEAVKAFKKQVNESIESGQYRSTHQMYMDRCRDTGQPKEQQGR